MSIENLLDTIKRNIRRSEAITLDVEQLTDLIDHIDCLQIDLNDAYAKECTCD